MSSTPRIEYEKYRLDNGLQVILHVDRRLPVVHVNQWYHVGSKNERPGRTGFAHLFEHLMFEGSKNADGEYFKYVEKIGANLREGGVNGTTSNDRTNYFVTAPSGTLEYLLWLESDRLTGLADAMTQEKLDNQRDVVRNERRQTVENRPYGRAFATIFENVFPAGHPYSWPVIGSHEDLVAASLDDVKEFFRTYYSPNNLTLTIAGDFDVAEAKQLIATYYGSILPGPPLARIGARPAPFKGERRLAVFDNVGQARTYLVWPAVPFFHADEADLDLAAHILTSGLSSRLNRRLVYQEELCTSVSASMYGMEIAGLFLVMASARAGGDLAPIETAIAQEIRRFADEGPSPEELARARTRYELDFVSGLERIGGFGGKADRLALYNTFLGDPGYFEKDLERYRAATVDSVRRTVERYLVNNDRLVLHFKPEVSKKPAEETLDRTQAPVVRPDRPFTVPAVERFQLENGLSALVVSRRELPMVAVRVVLKSGGLEDPPDRLGRALLTARVLDKGAPSRNALQIEDALADLGTSMGAAAGRESTWVYLTTLRENLEPALALLAEVVQHATFPGEELARERRKVMEDLKQMRKDPGRLAGRILSSLVFGPTHPYGRPVGGDESTLEGLTRDDLVTHHAQGFAASRALVIMAGDIDPGDARRLVEKHFTSFPRGALPAVTIPEPESAPWKRIYLVDRPGSAQAMVTQFLPGVTWANPRYHALKMVDAVWGGGFNSRLLMNLREEKGYTYGVSSSLGMHRTHGWWQAGGAIQTPVTPEAIREFLKEFEDLRQGRPITSEELESARDNRIRGFSQAFESLGRVAELLGSLWSQDRPLTDLEDEPARLAAVTLEQVHEAARLHLDPDLTSFLIVGDREKIMPGLEGLGFGPVVLLDENGQTV